MCHSKVSPLERIPDEPEETKKLLLDDLLEQTIGGFGKFQMAVMSLACAPILCVAIQVMSWTFVASEQIFPGNSSIFSQWGVEPDNRPQIKATIQAFYFMGQLVGSYTTGIMGDRYGRKVTMYMSLFIQSVCGLLLSVAPNWWSFSIMKFGTGFSQPGLYGIACLYSVEMLGKDHRRLCAIIVAVFYTAGMLLIPLAAYYIPNQALFHAVLSAPSFLFMLYWWALPESPRWLVAKGRVDEAEDVIKKAAKINNRDFPKDWQSHLLTPPQTAKIECSFGVLDLFRTPKMRKRILVSTILWPTTTMLYYGLTMKADLNGGSLYISYILSTLIELPGIVFIYTLINVLGRRLLLTISLLFCAGFLLANWALAPYASNIVLLSLLLTSKAGSKVAAQVTYTHLPEMMPTLLRTTAVGYASATGRVGAIMASYITYWMVDTHGIAALIVPFSSFSLVSALLVQVFLPETYGKTLPDTVEDVENKED